MKNFEKNIIIRQSDNLTGALITQKQNSHDLKTDSSYPSSGKKKGILNFHPDSLLDATKSELKKANKDLDEDVALMNARLARILTCEDYDPINRQVIPWTPTPGYRIDDGAELQDQEVGRPAA